MKLMVWMVVRRFVNARSTGEASEVYMAGYTSRDARAEKARERARAVAADYDQSAALRSQGKKLGVRIEHRIQPFEVEVVS
jgi:hypothetical protein